MTSAPNPNSASQSAQQIRNPRRLLILSPSSHSSSTIPSLLHSLTETPVADPPASFAGYTTHPPLRLTNRYYTADIPIWVDEIPLPAAPQGEHAHAHTLTHTHTQTQTQTQTEEEGKSAPSPSPSPAQWAVEFSSADARVVRDAIGALVICIRNLEDSPTNTGAGTPESRDDVRNLKEFLSAVGRVKGVIEEERGEVGDVPVLLVLVGSEQGHKDANARLGAGVDARNLEEVDADADASDEPFSAGWWEDQLFEMGMMGVEVVEWDPKGVEGGQRNVYGGSSFLLLWMLLMMSVTDCLAEYQGMRRIREVLETHDWAAPSDDADPGGFGEDGLEEHLLGLDRKENGFDLEVNELEREMLGLRMAIDHGGDGMDDQDEYDDEEDDDGLKVESLEALMMRMQAIRGMSFSGK